MNWYIGVFKKYVDFSGRARRMEYWMFVLINTLVVVAAAIADNVFGLVTEGGVGLLGACYSLAVLLPSLAVSVRRLHDTDRTGWWMLIGLIPLIGLIVLIVFFVSDSQAGQNRFGANPKDAAAPA